MLRRLFLCLCLAWLAAPAISMPVVQTETIASMPGHCDDAPSDHDAPPGDGMMVSLHGCIGCIAPLAPSLTLPSRVAYPVVFTRASSSILTSRHLIPEPPPPRAV